MDAVVDQLSRGRLLHDMPRRERRVWGSDIHIIEDRARRLVPYWLDQEYVTDFLRHIYPPSGVTVARIGDDESEPVIRWPKERRGRYAPPLPGTMVLVLGDLGCLASEGEALRRFWLHWGLRLQARQIPAVALVPMPSRDIPRELARVWTVVCWDAASPGVSDIESRSPETAVTRLLTLLSPVVRLESGLLRAVRRLLPEGRGDAGLEARVWQDTAIASRHIVAATLDPDQRRVYQSRFAGEPKGLRRLVLDRVQAWRANLHEAVWFEEVIGLDPQSQGECVDAADLQDASAFVTAFADALTESGIPSSETAAWILRLSERLPAEAWQRHPGIQRLYDLVRPRDPDSPVPLGYDPSNAPPAKQDPRQVTLWQAANRLLVQTGDAQAVLRGSPLGAVQTASGEVMVVPGRREIPVDEFWQSGNPPGLGSPLGPGRNGSVGDVPHRRGRAAYALDSRRAFLDGFARG